MSPGCNTVSVVNSELDEKLAAIWTGVVVIGRYHSSILLLREWLMSVNGVAN